MGMLFRILSLKMVESLGSFDPCFSIFLIFLFNHTRSNDVYEIYSNYFFKSPRLGLYKICDHKLNSPADS